MDISKRAHVLNDAIKNMKAFDKKSSLISLDRAIEITVEVFIEIAFSGARKAIFIGNGASAAIASHMAVDFWKNAGVKAISFNDPAQLTCLSNDLGYENVFSHPIDVLANPGDLLVAISSSGASPNILNAADMARKKKCWILTLSGFKESNFLRFKGDMNFFVGNSSYGIVETAHAFLCHYFLDSITQIQKRS
jgi:D-sedoheptulose 7-phosphate isomerase